MKKLDDIPKEIVYNVPDGYFKSLPAKIHARTIGRESAELPETTGFRLWYAIPVLVLAVAALFWFSQEAEQADAETLLASVDTEELVSYLNDHEMITFEFSDFDPQSINIDSLESEAYLMQPNETEIEFLENMIAPDSL